jgi:hypothetical protein
VVVVEPSWHRCHQLGWDMANAVCRIVHLTSIQAIEQAFGSVSYNVMRTIAIHN